jgi:AcrR family transcriptional regulator
MDSMLALIRENGAVPTARAIADRAGLTERTIFNLFDDKRALTLAGVGAFRKQALAQLPAVPKDDDLQCRVQRFFEPFALFLEDYSRIRWAALTARTAIPDMERGVVLEAVFDRITALLDPDGICAGTDPQLAAALRAAVDPMTWRLYRVQQRLSMKESRETMIRSVLALARSAPG